MKISIIEELLNGELQTRWEFRDKSPEANEVYAEYHKYGDEIDALLSPEHSKLWDDYFWPRAAFASGKKERLSHWRAVRAVSRAGTARGGNGTRFLNPSAS